MSSSSSSLSSPSSVASRQSSLDGVAKKVVASVKLTAYKVTSGQVVPQSASYSVDKLSLMQLRHVCVYFHDGTCNAGDDDDFDDPFASMLANDDRGDSLWSYFAECWTAHTCTDLLRKIKSLNNSRFGGTLSVYSSDAKKSVVASHIVPASCVLVFSFPCSRNSSNARLSRSSRSMFLLF